MLDEQFYAKNDQILCYGTLRAIGKISVKNAKRFDKNGVFRCFCAIFHNDRRSLPVRYGALKKFG
jgi:hypothetical protein